MKYQIGLDPKDFKAEKEVNWAKHLASIAGQLLSYGGPMLISAGASSEQTFPVLLPFIPLADIVAFQVKNGAPILILAIYADGLDLGTLTQRFQQYLELAKPVPQFGLKLNGSATVPAGVCPLLVFFDESCYRAAVRDLLPKAHIKKLWDKLTLSVGFVNVPGKQVNWPEPHGLEHVGAWVAKTFHQKLYPFETADLLNVLTLADLPA
jgi:hypothetical protein